MLRAHRQAIEIAAVDLETRNARLVVRLGHVATLYHEKCRHWGSVRACQNRECIKTLFVIEHNGSDEAHA